MSYEFTHILQKCNKNETQMLIDFIDSYFNFTDDAGLKKLLEQWHSGNMPIALAKKLETEIRYLGSNDVAYLCRKIIRKPAGVSIHEMINDVASRYKLKITPSNSIEYRLENLCKAIFEKNFINLSKDQKIKILKDMHLDEVNIEQILDQINKNKKLLIQILSKLLGKKALQNLIKQTILGVMTSVISKQAANQLCRALVARVPGGLNPIFLIPTTVLFIKDMMGSAMRKTIPILLLLGIICVHDGPEKPDEFYN